MPDPNETGLSEQFDSYYEAFQQAAQNAGFLFNQYSLPWIKRDDPTDNDPDNGPGSDKDPKTQTSISDGENDWIKQVEDDSDLPDARPGIVLFRSSKQGALLVAFIVGELPTKGVHRRAMRAAFATADFLNHSNAFRPPPQPLSVLGPSFSGSAESILYSFYQWLWFAGPRDSASPLNIITGAATKPDFDNLNSIVLRANHLFKAKPKIAFHTTVAWDQNIWSTLGSVLCGTFNAQPKDIAILGEEGTAYGSKPKSDLRRDECLYNPDVLYLTFPLHIKALMEQPSPEESTILRSRMLFSGSEVPLVRNLSDERDIIPPFAPTDKNTVQLELERAFRDISDQRIHYVIITATDPFDIIYLAQQLHSWSPNTKIISLTDDILFFNISVNDTLSGMLIASTYPDFDSNQVWTWPNQGTTHREQFASDFSEGVFDAATAILNYRLDDRELKFWTDPSSKWLLPFVGPDDLSGDSMQPNLGEPTPEKVTPFVVPYAELNNLLEYSPPFGHAPSRQVPPLWLSAVGNSYAYPIATLPLPDSDRPPVADGAARQEPGLPKGDVLSQAAREILPWSSLASIFVLDCFALGLALLVLATKFSTSKEAPKWLRTPLACAKWFGDYPPPPGKALIAGLVRDGSLARRKVRLFYFACFLCPVPLFFTITLGVALHDLPSNQGWWPEDPWATSLCGWCGLSSAICLLTAWARGRESRNVRAWLLGSASAIAFLVAGIAPFVATLQDDEGWSHFHLFVAMRAVRLFSDVSFLTPVILVVTGALVLAASGLVVSRIVIERPLLGAYHAEDLTSFSGIFALRRRFVAELLRPWFGARRWSNPAYLATGLGSLVFLCVWVFRRGWLITVEGRLFDYSFFAIVLVLYASISLTLCRVLFLWSIVRALLRRLYRHPTRVYYSKFNTLITGEEGKAINLLALSPTTNFLSIALERARNLQRLVSCHKTRYPCPKPDLFDSLKSAYSTLTPLSPTASISTHDPATALNWKDWRRAIKDTWQSESAMAERAIELLTPIEDWWGIDFKTEGASVTDCERDARAVMDNAGLLVAAGVAGFVRNALPHLQSLALASTLASLLLLFAMSSYSLFLNINDLLVAGWILVFLSIAVTTGIYVSMNRDRVLSMISGTRPGEVTWSMHFVGQLALHAIIPLLAILGTSFPASVDQLVAQISSLMGNG